MVLRCWFHPILTWVFSPHQAQLWLQLGVLQSSSVLTLSTWRSIRCHRFRAQHCRTDPDPSSDPSCKARFAPVLLTDGLWLEFPWPPSFLKQLPEVRERNLLLIRSSIHCQIGETHRQGMWEGHRAFLSSSDVHSLQISTSLSPSTQGFWTLNFGDFYGGFITRHA